MDHSLDDFTVILLLGIEEIRLFLYSIFIVDYDSVHLGYFIHYRQMRYFE